MGTFQHFGKLLEFTVNGFRSNIIRVSVNTPENQLKRFTVNYYLHSTLELELTTSTFCITCV